LRTLSQSDVSVFAYPNGTPGRDYNAAHVNIVRACGFNSAVSAVWGYAGADSDPFQLPRIAPWDRTPARFCMRLLSSYRNTQSQRVAMAT
jgi:hypothetical protein